MHPDQRSSVSLVRLKLIVGNHACIVLWYHDVTVQSLVNIGQSGLAMMLYYCGTHGDGNSNSDILPVDCPLTSFDRICGFEAVMGSTVT
eukprot:1352914-Amorphochlora_amoeboformis.AAC.2